MKLSRTLAFFALIISLFALISTFFPQPNIEIFGLNLRFPSVQEIISSPTTDTLMNVDEVISDVEASLQIVDSVELAWQDSMKFYNKFFTENSARIICPSDNPEFLFPFFEALDSAKNESVHIIHYGDSQIEGDRISGYLRASMQKKFGGNGPGLLPLWQPVGAHSVGQTLSDAVECYYAGGMMGQRANHKRYGAMAQMAQLDEGDTIKMSILARQTKNFQRVIIFCGNNSDDLVVQFGKSQQVVHESSKMKHISWKLNKPTNRIDLWFMGQSEIYGIFVDGNEGVSLSNIPMRGSDGTFFTRIEGKGIEYMLSHLNTRLIIMEFGGNALPMLKDTLDVEKYCKGFVKQIDYLHRLQPKSAIIVIGTADMAVKRQGVLQTHPMLPYLVDCIRDSTISHGAGYWDMYNVMGGYNSMKSWVTHSPALAAPDYIHFTSNGANRIAEIFWQTLMVYYDYRDMIKNRQQCEQ